MLEELLIPYTLPGLTLLVLVAILVPPDTLLRLLLEAPATTPIVLLITGWGLAIGLSAAESAFGRMLDDVLDQSRLQWLKTWLASADKRRNELAIEAMELNSWKQRHERYELLRSRLYVWAEFNRGMSLTLPAYAFAFPTLLERYFPLVQLSSMGWFIVWAIFFFVELAVIRNWQRNMRRWEWFEGVRP